MATIQKISYPTDTYKMFKVPEFRYCEPILDAKTEAKQKTQVALCALLGAVVPVIVLNCFKKGNLEGIKNAFKNKLPFKDKFKSIWKLLEIENYSQILVTATGGILGGFLGGKDFSKTKEDKEAKYKEAIFEFLNTMIPTTLVAGGLKLLKKLGKLKSIPLQAAMIASSVAGGMFIANKASNKINELVFDKDKKEEDRDIRHFKITDCLVHIDDLVTLAVLTKIPLASKLQVDKILPLLYARTGYEVGTAKANKKD